MVLLLCHMIMIARAESDNSEFEAKMIALENKLESMEKKLSALEGERTYEAFDCYRIGNWDVNATITFDSCSVDMTTQDPWTGNFMVPTAGLWRFTAMATAYVIDPAGYGYIRIKVDGITAAISYANPDNGATGRSTLSISTIQQLEVGQNVSIVWTGHKDAYLYSNNNKYTHWTGAYMGSGTVAPPECDYTGQTFEYPGSCRKYTGSAWLTAP